jgi:polyisoprenoid-binding protein YceI
VLCTPPDLANVWTPKELREIVFEPEKYPEIVFKSTDVSGKALGNQQFEVKIGGDLTSDSDSVE